MQLPMVNPHACARYDPMICHFEFILTKYFRNCYVGSTNLREAVKNYLADFVR